MKFVKLFLSYQVANTYYLFYLSHKNKIQLQDSRGTNKKLFGSNL